MDVTGHRSEEQMRRDYFKSKIYTNPRLQILTVTPALLKYAKWAPSDDIRARATMQVFKYLDGQLPRLPPTVVEVYGEIVDHICPINIHQKYYLFATQESVLPCLGTRSSTDSMHAELNVIVQLNWLN